MYRFVDLNDSYWTNPDGSEGAQCAILDTRTNRFLECDGQHVLGGIGEVREAAGERGAGLVPAGFFERRPSAPGQFVECDTCRAKPGSPVLCDDCLRRRREWCGRRPAAPLTLADVIQAENALADANVPPPYELRATAAALAGLAATLPERCNAEATAAGHMPTPTLQPGETFIGRVSQTLLIAVDAPPAPAFRVKGNTPVGEAVYEPDKGPPIFAR